MKHRSAVIAGIVGVVAVALIVLFLTADIDGDPLDIDTNRLVGKPAPAIDATDTAGRPFSIGDYRGRWLLVNFFAQWCGPCIKEHPELVAFSEAHSRLGDASVVSVAYNDTAKAVKEFFAENGGDWAVIADSKSDYAIEYAVVGLPESYLVNPEGVIVHKFVGGITKAGVEAEMAKNATTSTSTSTSTSVPS